MLTKNAIGNMINRYNAVLKKCRLINLFGVNVLGSLALAGAVAMGGPCVGDAWADDITTVEAGTTLASEASHVASAIVVDPSNTSTAYKIGFDVSLALTGNKNSSGKYILVESGLTVTNYGTLYLGATWDYDNDDEPVGVEYTSYFNGTLTSMWDAEKDGGTPTTAVYSSVTFVNKTTIYTSTTVENMTTEYSSSALLSIKAGTGNTVTMAGLDLGVGDAEGTTTRLNINTGTLELVAQTDTPNADFTTNGWNATTSDSFNSTVADIIALDYDTNDDGESNTTTFSDSNIDGELEITGGASLVISSGVTNIVDANMWTTSTFLISGTIEVSGTIDAENGNTTATLVAALGDFVSVTPDESDEANSTKEITDATSDTPVSSLSLRSSMTGSYDADTTDTDDEDYIADSKVILTTDAATLILDGEASYINKEAFAELLNSGAWANFVYDSTDESATLVIDYGTNNSTDTGAATLDNTYTFDTDSGTITITNLYLTSYYSLGSYLVNTDGTTAYTLNEAVFGSGTLTGNLTASTLLDGTSSTLLNSTSDGIIAVDATLTLTGDSYVDEDGTTVAAGTLVEGGSVINNGTLILGENATTDALWFNGTLESTGTLTVKSDVAFTEETTISGDLSVGDDASITASGSSAVVSIAADTLKDSLASYTLDFDTYVTGGGTLIFGELPTDGSTEETEYTYIMDTVDNADTMSLLYVDLDTTLTMDSGTSLVVGSGSSTSSSSLYFGADSLFIADMASIEADEAVISGGGNTLTIVDGSSLGLINAAEGTYTILEDFTVSGTSTAWDADSVTIGNYLLAVDYVSGTGSASDPYTVTVRKNVDEALYSADGGGILAEVLNNDNFNATTSDPVAQIIYQASLDSTEAVAKAQASLANSGASSGSTAAGMSAVRSSAATFDVRNTVVHIGSVADAGGTLLVKDANGKVTAEYNNVMEVADGGSVSDVPSGLGGTKSGIGNTIGVWAMPFYAHESVSGAKVGSYTNDTHTDMYGVTMGVDKTFTPKGLDILRIGLAFNMGTGETEGYGDTGNSVSDFDFFGLATYGSIRKDALTVSGSISYTNTDSEFVTETSTGETDTDVWYGILNAEYALDMGGLQSSEFFSHFKFVPYAGIGFMTSKTDDYTTNSGYIEVENDRQNVFTFPVGLKFNKEFQLDSGWILKPEVGAGVIFADGDLYQRSETTYGSSLTPIKSQVMDKTTMDVGFSFDIRKDEFGLFLDYSLQKSDTRTAHGVSAKFELRF